MSSQKADSLFIEALERVSNALKNSQDGFKLENLFSLLGTSGYGVIIIFMCLPFLQPIPLPGISTPLGILIILVAYFRLKSAPIKLPQKLAGIYLPKMVLEKSLFLAVKIAHWMNRLTKKRFSFLLESRSSQYLNFSIVSISSLLLALPLPIPMTNTFPCYVIILNALAHLEDDGVVISFSYLMFLATLVYYAFIFSSIKAALQWSFNQFNWW